MTQTKLDNFFTIRPNTNNNSKKCFIYDPDEYRAFFDNIPDSNRDIFLSNKLDIKLYYRVPLKTTNFEFPIINSAYRVPLLKSNLQKAIRRGKTEVAISTALFLLQSNSIEFLRRLPIIFIEDVCLMDSISIPIWLIMCDKEYKLTSIDTYILLHIVKSLCECKLYYDHRKKFMKPFELIHETLKDYSHKDELLSLYYRSKYGGMKGDIEMLVNSIYYYIGNPLLIGRSSININYEFQISRNLVILPEAIDFHPFPYMINIIIKNTNLNYKDIKSYIWYTESCVNFRKSYTISKSNKNITDDIWKKIKPELEKVRKIIINQ